VDPDGRADDARRRGRHRRLCGLNPHAPPADTGDALGLPASRLTLTIGFGPTFFLKAGKDRFGIADK
jgi:hypothetical protein